MDALYDQLIEFGRRAAAGGLLASTCGNVSLRAPDARLLISGTGSVLGSLRALDVALVTLGDGAHLAGPRPSMETALHRGIYEIRPDVGAVLHCQSNAATLLACLEDPPARVDVIPEVPAYVGRHVYVPWAMPGSEALARSVVDAFRDEDVGVVQMGNHGQVVVGPTFEAALQRATFFEFACAVVASGQRVRLIPVEDAEALRAYGRRASACHPST